jgi:hypothetical protein
MSQLDQFYTNKDIAKKYYEILRTKVNIDDYDVVLEPSAGMGSFYDLMDPNKRVGIDISPKHEEIIQQDFFDYIPDKTKKYICIGNPPFGRVCSTAVKFFNKCATFSECIAFIIPRTFKRVSIQNRLNKEFHLVYNEDIPLAPCCFTPKMAAKCCFQIWVKRSVLRELVIYDKTHKDFNFIRMGPRDENKQPTPPKDADFAMKAYGSNCGEIKEKGLETLRPKSWHWITSNIDKHILIQRFNSLDYSISEDTVRQNSIGQQEVIYLYKKSFG